MSSTKRISPSPPDLERCASSQVSAKSRTTMSTESRAILKRKLRLAEAEVKKLQIELELERCKEDSSMRSFDNDEYNRNVESKDNAPAHSEVAKYIENLPDATPVRSITGACSNPPSLEYLPHHPVMNPHKPDKVRVVFDCAGSLLKTTSSPLSKLDPLLADGVIPVAGRLRWAPLPFETKHPSVLPKDHFVSRLIIRHYHAANGHVGASQVLASVRQRFWICQGHAATRKVLPSCHHCRRWHGLPGNQLMAPLPTDRTTPQDRPFGTVGVDYFGPLLVRRGRGTEKRYGRLFMCLTMRAVHIEVSHNLETDSFLCAFARLVARRGNPHTVYSDNGTNFRGAEAEVRNCLRHWVHERIAGKLSERDCDWNFTTPKASHRGGAWERMIRSVRRILRSVLGEQLVDDETLHMALMEVEKILNERPLTKLNSDPTDLAALTPSHLLLIHRNSSETPTDSRIRSALSKRWKGAQYLADVFWARWRRVYLCELQRLQKWWKRKENFRPGDLVILVDATTPRDTWAKGIVDQAIAGSDGLVREVMVRTNDGTYKRDIRNVCLLEADEEHNCAPINAHTDCSHS